MPDLSRMLQYYTSPLVAADEASGTLVLDGAQDGVAARQYSPMDRRFAGVVGLSALLHVSLAAAFLIGSGHDHAGGGTTELDVVSVSIMSVADGQSAASTSASAPAHVPQTMPDVPGGNTSSDAPSKTIQSAVKQQQQQPPDPPDPELPQPALDMAVLDVPPVIDEQSKPPEQPEDPEPRKDISERAADASQVGSTPTSPVSVGGNTIGQAAASRGAMERYARSVALVVASKKPKGVGRRGTVTIEFSLVPSSGALLKATVVKSSGNAKLDGMAMTAIETAKYAMPPPNMTSAQLTYRVPFTFE